MKTLFTFLLVLSIAVCANAQSRKYKKKILRKFGYHPATIYSCPTYYGTASSAQNRAYFSRHWKMRKPKHQ